MLSSLRQLALGMLVLVVILAGWEVYCVVSGVSPVFLPSPTRIWQAFVRGMELGTLPAQTQATIGRMVGGWLIASVIGVTAGVIVGTSPRLQLYLMPTLEFIRPMPSSAVVPVMIGILGLTEGMVLFIICFGAVWPVLLNTVQGVMSVEPRLKEVSRIMGMSQLAFIWKISLPNALPVILAGMRLSISVALILTIIGEMVASQTGLGQGMILASRGFRSAELFASLFLLGAIGFLSSTALSWVEGRVLAHR